MYTVEEFDKEKSRVMNYIMYKKRSEYEVKNKFSNTIQQDMLYDIILYIIQAGYLNDADYVQRAVDEFMAINILSIKEIQYKLYSKGINKNIIEDYLYNNKEILEEYELNSAKKVVIKKSRIMENQEIKQYLIKKGYKQEIVKEVL